MCKVCERIGRTCTICRAEQERTKRQAPHNPRQGGSAILAHTIAGWRGIRHCIVLIFRRGRVTPPTPPSGGVRRAAWGCLESSVL